jgi:hypothetical protein
MDIDMIKPFLQKGKLDQERWIETLERVRVYVAPKLPRFKLKTFGELACVGPEPHDSRYRLLDDDNPESDPKGSHTLKNHGIAYFGDTGERVTSLDEVRTFAAWGLSKDNRWVRIDVTVKGVMHPKYQIVHERAQTVLIGSSDVQDMLGHAKVPPFTVFSTIICEVDRWRSSKHLQAKEADRFGAPLDLLKDTIIHGLI